MSRWDDELEVMKRVLEGNGGRMESNPNSPEWVKREFARALWDCEECRQALIEGGLVRPH